MGKMINTLNNVGVLNMSDWKLVYTFKTGFNSNEVDMAMGTLREFGFEPITEKVSEGLNILIHKSEEKRFTKLFPDISNN